LKLRVFDLEPVLASAARVGAAQALRHDAFKAEPA
jgi:hypothetical protein